MTWSQIKRAFPNEWVAIAHYDLASDDPYGDISGDVVAHDLDESKFTKQVKSLSKDVGDIDIRFTGEVLPDNPVGPVLWQM